MEKVWMVRIPIALAKGMSSVCHNLFQLIWFDFLLFLVFLLFLLQITGCKQPMYR